MADIAQLRQAVLRVRNYYVSLLRARRELQWHGDPLDNRRAAEVLDRQIAAAKRDLDTAKDDLERHRAVRDAAHAARNPAPQASSSYVKNPPWLRKALGR